MPQNKMRCGAAGWSYGDCHSHKGKEGGAIFFWEERATGHKFAPLRGCFLDLSPNGEQRGSAGAGTLPIARRLQEAVF
jgi:hypothetical protein